MAPKRLPSPAEIDKAATFEIGRTSFVELGNGAKVPERFLARYELSYGTVELELLVEDQRARVTQLRVRENSRKGVPGVTVEGLAVAQLADYALFRVAALGAVSSVDDVARIRSATMKATRRRVTETRLEDVADAYKSEGYAGIQKLGIGVRHAYRLKKRAQEAGLLEEEDER